MIKSKDESDDSQGQVIPILISSNIFDIWTKLEVLLGLKSSGQMDTLREPTNLIDEIYRRNEIKNEQHRKAIDNFFTF